MSKHDSIHKLIKERFGSNRLSDERFSKKTYWDSLFESTENGEKVEPIGADPNVLPEEAGAWFQKPVDIGNKEMVDRVLKILNPEHRKILIMIGLEGRTVKEVATTLNLTRQSIYKKLERIKKLVVKSGILPL